MYGTEDGAFFGYFHCTTRECDENLKRVLDMFIFSHGENILADFVPFASKPLKIKIIIGFYIG